MMDEGLWKQLPKGKFNIDYGRPARRITYRDIFMVKIHICGGQLLKYTVDKITTEEQLDVALKHYQFLRKYNLL